MDGIHRSEAIQRERNSTYRHGKEGGKEGAPSGKRAPGGFLQMVSVELIPRTFGSHSLSLPPLFFFPS